MEIYLIRHTAPKADPKTCYGQLDLELMDTFLGEAETIVTQIRNTQMALVYSSPLKRCISLAKLLSKSPIVDRRLMEINFGEWEGRKWGEIDRKPLDRWMADFVNARCPGGESFKDLEFRVLDFLSEIKRAEVERAVLVTHGGVIRTIVAFAEGTPLSHAFDIRVEYGEVRRIVI
ncbi:MAG: alpha-ribazole phosphatase [Planctomycetes bacterium]|nr:alpha-ribazole phosphatase [Planctomycetota bacterium]